MFGWSNSFMSFLPSFLWCFKNNTFNILSIYATWVLGDVRCRSDKCILWWSNSFMSWMYEKMGKPIMHKKMVDWTGTGMRASNQKTSQRWLRDYKNCDATHLTCTAVAIRKRMYDEEWGQERRRRGKEARRPSSGQSGLGAESGGARKLQPGDQLKPRELVRGRACVRRTLCELENFEILIES